jgi:phenylacetate-CoA ligase
MHDRRVMSRRLQPSLLPFRSQVAGIEWPPLMTGAAAAMAAMLGRLDRSQWFDAATLRSLQFRQLSALAEHAATHSPQFGRRLRAAGLVPEDLATAEGLVRLPPLRRQDVQSAPDLFCVQIPPDHAPVREARTSGSTGEPVCIRRTAVTQFMWSAHVIRDMLWHPRDFKARQCAIRANVNQVQRFSDWGGLVASMFETGEVLVVPITTPLAELVAMLDDFRPDNLVAYPNVVAAMVEACRRRGDGIEGLGHLRMIGETLSPALRRDVQEVLGAAVTDVYSSEEIGYITLQCPDTELHHVMAETVLIEVLRDDGSPCDEGELGKVVATDLHNFATPMIRYEMGDYAEVGPPCSCGRGLPTLRRIVGRERNLLRLPDGGRHWPLLGGLHFRDVAPVRQFQAIQHDFERIEVRLIVERAMTDVEERDLRAMILRALGHPFTLDLCFFEGRLPTGPNGKFEEFVCAMGTA